MFLSPTNSIHLGSLMIPSGELCRIKLKIHKCLHDICLCCLFFKALVCQVSTPGCQGEAQQFCFPRTCILFQKMKRRKRRVYLPGKVFISSMTSLVYPFPKNNAFLGLFQYSFSGGRTGDSRLIPLIGLYLNCLKWVFQQKPSVFPAYFSE